MSESQLAERPQSVKDYLALPAYKDRFAEVLRSRAPQFMAAITAVSNSPALKDAEPRSIIAAAMVAATLDLPVNPTLGQAHIVAYGDGQGNKVAQFQIGYKGLIQLALRSGQYKRLNAGPVSAGVFTGFDLVGEPILDFTKNDPLAETAGYYCAFETLNGFIKVVYWSKQQAEAHGKRFSRAYAKGYSTPWKSDFDSMAVKTVIKAALGKWGILSVEMQKAVVHDQGAQEDVDADVKYVDDGKDENVVHAEKVERAAPPPRKKKGVNAAVDAEVVSVTEEPKAVTPAAAPEKAADPAPVSQPLADKAPEAAPVESFQQAAAATEAAPAEPAPVKQEPRAFLNDKEEIETEVTVAELNPLNITQAGVVNPSVKAKLKGGFVGEVYHIGGGIAEGEAVKPKQPWAVGATLKVKLLGKINAKAGGKIQVFVQAVSAVTETEEF